MWEIEVKNANFYPWPISLSVMDEQVFLSKEDAEKMISELQDAVSIIDKNRS